MCTVTYLPLSKHSFILTSNRDENPLRIALPPAKYLHYGQSIYYPKDPQAGGTWIASSEKNFTLCLLNGAFKKHQHLPPYRISRGIMLLDFFKYNDAEKFAAEYNFIGIEPFTLLLIGNSVPIIFYELRWDGLQVHLRKVDVTQPEIWSSAMLYPDDVINQRRQWFAEWLANHNNYTTDTIFKFHRFGGNDDEANKLVMNRENKVRTVSITMINQSDQKHSMLYNDLLQNKVDQISIID